MKADVAKLPWVEKYRPSTLDELVSHGEIVKTIQKFIRSDQLPHLLFHGPPGTGKTSMILACARHMYPDPTQFRLMVLELNASDDRGIGVVRDRIMNFASTGTGYAAPSSNAADQQLPDKLSKTAHRASSSVTHKLIILDEADAMTTDAQNALRRIVEQFTSNVRFCMICNYLTSIIPALQSRCTRFRFGPLDSEQMILRLRSIADAENVKVTDDGFEALYAISNGDMRKALCMMQSAHLSRSNVNADSVYESAGYPSPQQINVLLTILFNDSIREAYQRVQTLKKEKGFCLSDLVTESSKLCMRTSLPDQVKMTLIKKLADLEYRISFGTTDECQTASFVSAFQCVRAVGMDKIDGA